MYLTYFQILAFKNVGQVFEFHIFKSYSEQNGNKQFNLFSTYKTRIALKFSEKTWYFSLHFQLVVFQQFYSILLCLPTQQNTIFWFVKLSATSVVSLLIKNCKGANFKLFLYLHRTKARSFMLNVVFSRRHKNLVQKVGGKKTEEEWEILWFHI